MLPTSIMCFFHQVTVIVIKQSLPTTGDKVLAEHKSWLMGNWELGCGHCNTHLFLHKT